MAPGIARTNQEAQLYIDLHPCECGESGLPRTASIIEAGDDVPASHYSGNCPGCGTLRQFTFPLPAAMPLPPADGSLRFGGPEPSQIIDPGEWLRVADGFARAVPASPAGEERDNARTMLRGAVAAIDEVLKFIPPGADQVPEQAFAGPATRAAHAREPGRFRRQRLEAVRETYASALDDLQVGGVTTADAAGARSR